MNEPNKAAPTTIPKDKLFKAMKIPLNFYTFYTSTLTLTFIATCAYQLYTGSYVSISNTFWDSIEFYALGMASFIFISIPILSIIYLWLKDI